MVQKRSDFLEGLLREKVFDYKAFSEKIAKFKEQEKKDSGFRD